MGPRPTTIRAATIRAATARATGFTLVEMMVVLALLVIIAAMVAPALNRPYENFKLRKGGEQVRTMFARAQMRAIQSGQIQVLVFVPGGGQCQIRTYATDQDVIESSVTSGVIGAPQATPLANPTGTMKAKNETLPEGVVFVEAGTDGDVRDQLAQQQNANAGGLGSVAPGDDLLAQGGIPLMFYPDGTSSTARVVLTNNLGAFIVLKLRGLTGVAEVTDLLSAAELP